MMGVFRKLFGTAPKDNYSAMVKNGAIVVDVRTADEFKSGHIKGAENVPLDTITMGKHKFKDKQKPMILCCRSGMRSASAVSILQKQGFTQVVNGGGWHTLQSQLNQ